MLIWVSRKRQFRKGCAGGTTSPTAPPGEANGAGRQAEEGQMEESLLCGEALLLAKVFLFFLAIAGIGLLMGYVALTSLPLAQH